MRRWSIFRCTSRIPVTSIDSNIADEHDSISGVSHRYRLSVFVELRPVVFQIFKLQYDLLLHREKHWLVRCKKAVQFTKSAKNKSTNFTKKNATTLRILRLRQRGGFVREFGATFYENCEFGLGGGAGRSWNVEKSLSTLPWTLLKKLIGHTSYFSILLKFAKKADLYSSCFVNNSRLTKELISLFSAIRPRKYFF
jgi:hypothetical protein